MVNVYVVVTRILVMFNNIAEAALACWCKTSYIQKGSTTIHNSF